MRLRAIAVRIRSATRSASIWRVSGSSRPNSSPPRRAKLSTGRISCRASPATARRASSPAVWPNRSLIDLKSSRSKITIETGRAVALGAPDLLLERLVEEAPVVDAGQRVADGLLELLAVVASVLDPDRELGGQQSELLESPRRRPDPRARASPSRRRSRFRGRASGRRTIWRPPRVRRTGSLDPLIHAVDPGMLVVPGPGHGVQLERAAAPADVQRGAGRAGGEVEHARARAR